MWQGRHGKKKEEEETKIGKRNKKRRTQETARHIDYGKGKDRANRKKEAHSSIWMGNNILTVTAREMH